MKKFNLVQINQIKKYRHQGFNLSDIAKKLKISRTLIYYYYRKSQDILYRSRKVGRPKGNYQKINPYGEYTHLIKSLPINSYYKSILTKKIERSKNSKL